MNTSLRNNNHSYEPKNQVTYKNNHSSVWELSIRNKKRRERQVRRNIIILITLITLSLTLTLSIFFGSFLSNAQNSTDDITYKYYQSIVIEPGDTIWSIADKHADSHYRDLDEYIQEVIHINYLEDDCTLNVGEYIIIPYYSSDFLG